MTTVFEYLGVPEENYWWCANCNSEVGGYNVTHNETCAICGHPVIIKCTPYLDGNLMVAAIQKMNSIVDEDDVPDLGKFETYAKQYIDEYKVYYNAELFGSPANFFKLMQEALDKGVIGGGV